MGERVRLTPGSVVPGTRYKITGWLGDGGMGVVYEAIHLDIGRRAALKVLHESLTGNAEEVEAFWDEARAATRIGSPYIVEIYDLTELPDGRLVSIMERLDGHTLEVEVQAAPMDPGRLVGVLRQTCKGLAAAHDVGIIHRDIKPANVFILEAKDKERRDRVTVLDFGLAVILSGESSGRELMGTPYYMSPEQILAKKFDGRLDMYALGCTAYELVAGRPPFTGENLKDILRQHLRSAPEPLRDIVGTEAIPEPIERVILRCLAKDPSDRYADMRDLEAALCEAQIEAKLTTYWDDLPVPDVAPDRREKIISAMPDASVMGGRKRGWLLPAVASAVITGSVVAMLAFSGGEATPAAQAKVDGLAEEARAAAARAFYIYPSSDNPDAPTAYTKVLELEKLRGDAKDLGEDRAAELRKEFAETLVYLADDYWAKPGGKSFAIDYYAQAIIFDSSNERAIERASLTPGQLANLKRKADEVDFSDEELTAVAPLVVLANKDEKKRRKGIERLREKPTSGAFSTHMELAQMLASAKKVDGADARGSAAKADPKPPPPPPEPPPAVDPFADATGSTAEQPVAVEDSTPAPTGKSSKGTSSGGASTGKYKRDPKRARAIARDGSAAQRKGDWRGAERLFHQALSADRNCAPALIGLSDIHFERGEHRSAVQYAEKAVAASRKNSSYRIKLGDAYLKVLRYGDAGAQYEKAAELGNAKAASRLAKLKSKVGG